MKKTPARAAIDSTVSETSSTGENALAPRVPVVGTPIIDKLAFILPVLVGLDYQEERIPPRMLKRIEKSIEKGKCVRWYATEGRFRMQLRIPLPSGVKAHVQIGAKKPLEQIGGIRIEMNPGKLLPGDTEALYKLMRRWLKDVADLDDLLRRARISRMDIAVDVLHCAISELLIGYKGVQQFTVFGNTMKNGAFQTINLGSMSSDYIAAVYNKRDEVLRRIVKEAEKGGASESLKANMIRQLKVAAGMPPIMRVEVRGMKIGKKVKDLMGLGLNRFERFQFIEIQNIAGLTDFERRNFLALAREVGLKAAVDLHKGQPTHRHVKKAVAQTAAWWQPKGLWKRGIKALMASGIFPEDAF